MLPNWLYGKSKSKLTELLGGGGTPSDYNQVKAQVTQNTEDITLLNSAVDAKVSWDDYSELGAVNLRNQDVKTITKNGITFTVSADKRITVSGVNDNTNASAILVYKKTGSSKPLKVYGVPSNANNGYCCAEVYDNTSNSRIGFVTGSNPEVIIPASNHNISIQIYVWRNQDISTPMEFPLMITPLSYKGDYIPPTMTNQEITDLLTVGAVSATANTDYLDGTNNVIFRKCGKMVSCEGYFQVTTTAAKAAVLYTLAESPLSNSYLLALKSTGVYVLLNVKSDGTIIVESEGGIAAGFYSLIGTFVLP